MLKERIRRYLGTDRQHSAQSSASPPKLTCYPRRPARPCQPEDPAAAAQYDLLQLIEVMYLDPYRPLDPVGMATKLGIKSFTTGLSPENSGMIRVLPGRDPEFYVNSDDSYERQRFEHAYLLGRWLEETGKTCRNEWEYIDWKTSLCVQRTTPEELYARHFAHALTGSLA